MTLPHAIALALCALWIGWGVAQSVVNVGEQVKHRRFHGSGRGVHAR